MEIQPYTPVYHDATISLWTECGLVRPWNDPAKDIARKLTVGPELFLLGVAGNTLVASVMGGYEGHRGWINYLAVAPAHRGRGYGRRLVQHLEQQLLDLGCPKLNLQVRGGNDAVIDFYRHLGFVPDGSVSLGKRLIADD